MFKVSQRRILIPLCAAALGGLSFVIISCTNTVTNPGGDIYGLDNMHCIDPMTGDTITQETSPAGCQATPDAGPPQPDAAVEEPDFGATNFGSAAFDDDCKYAVNWTATPVFENTDVFFTVVAKTTVDDQPATGANIFAEVFLDDMHEAPPTSQSAVEGPPGTYKVGPIQFDKPGAWTVRFHLHEDCKDLVDDSPHGHAAFYVNVP